MQRSEVLYYAEKKGLRDTKIIVDTEEQSRKSFSKRVLVKPILSRKTEKVVLLVHNFTLMGPDPLAISQEISLISHFIDLIFVRESESLELGLNQLISDIVIRCHDPNYIKPYHKDTKNKLKAEGKYLGGRKPFGWDVDASQRLTINPEEQEAIKIMVQMRLSGDSLRDISAKIKKMGYNLSHQGVQKILNANQDQYRGISHLKSK